MSLELNHVSRKYHRQGESSNYFFAVQDVSLTLQEGSITLLRGRSGSGKTTLLSMAAGILTPTSGEVLLDERNLYDMTERERASFRNQWIAVIPQGHSAIGSLTVMENICLPGQFDPRERDPVKDRATAKELLGRFGMADLASIYPAELSGGELRRMAICRALIRRPKLILADEPTADLDDENTALVLAEMQRAAKDGAAVLIVSHESDAQRYAKQIYRMDGGRIVIGSEEE